MYVCMYVCVYVCMYVCIARYLTFSYWCFLDMLMFMLVCYVAIATIKMASTVKSL